MIKAYSVYNKTLKCYYTPIFENDTTDLKKVVFDVINSPRESYIKNCPANYCFYEVGTFDGKTGKFDAYRKPILVLDCAELVQKEQRDG